MRQDLNIPFVCFAHLPRKAQPRSHVMAPDNGPLQEEINIQVEGVIRFTLTRVDLKQADVFIWYA